MDLQAVATTDAVTSAAIGRSNLRELPPASLRALVAGAGVRVARPGEILHDEGEDQAHLELVIFGLVRVFVLAPDGRSLTVRYVRPGGLVGAVSLYAPAFALPATIEAIVETRLLVLAPDTVRQAVATDPLVARALLTELGERVQAFIAEIPWGAFATVRQRVARRLLDLASEDVRGPEMVARISQQQLAAECGTVRGVVVRELRALRASGLVATRRDAITVLDPDALLRESGLDAV
jgi:CRP/FNR family cyclic AMP-dependent transcriptional regulator